MEEAAIHARAVQQPHSARVAVRQNRPGAVFRSRRPQALRDRLQSFVPRDAREAAAALAPGAPLRVQQAVRVVFALRVLRHFAAQKVARNRVRGAAAQAGSPLIAIGRDQ
jgi:hypothetical protein